MLQIFWDSSLLMAVCILINPNGVYIGGSAQIQTAGFIASTADISNESFENSSEKLFAAPGDGQIINKGSISCPKGDVFLIAKNIVNDGKIHADHVGLLSAQEVLIHPKESKVFIRLAIEDGSIENTGSIEALAIDLQTTSPYQKAIKHSGRLEATTVENRNGRIFLVANEGGAHVEGNIQAEAGTVHVLAKNVTLDEKAYIDVSGPRGGTVLVGGDYQGKNPVIQNAEWTRVKKDAVIKSDGLDGDGGKVIFWGDKGIDYRGYTSAQALGEIGDGGFVEVSSLGHYLYQGEYQYAFKMWICRYASYGSCRYYD